LQAPDEDIGALILSFLNDGLQDSIIVLIKMLLLGLKVLLQVLVIDYHEIGLYDILTLLGEH